MNASRTLLPLIAFTLAGSTMMSVAAGKTYEPNWASLDQRPTPDWFLDAKFGVFIHWGVYSVPAWGDSHQYAEWYWNHIANRNPTNVWWQFHQRNYGAAFDYQDFAPRFTAELFDAKQWANVFARAGVKYSGAHFEAPRGICLMAQR